MSDPPRYDCWKHVSKTYSFSDCVDECIFRGATRRCNCRLLITNQRDPNGRPYPPCTPYEQKTCFNPEVSASMKNPAYFNECKAKCKQPCDYWTYQPTISYAKFPAKTFFEYIPDGNEKEWSQYIILDIFYEKLEYTIIKHYESMPNVTFIANLGGQVGLWIGGSILSIAQVVCFMGNLLKIGFNKLRQLHRHCGNEQKPKTTNGMLKTSGYDSPTFDSKPLGYFAQNSSQRLISSGPEEFWQLRRSRTESELLSLSQQHNNSNISPVPEFNNSFDEGLTMPFSGEDTLVHRNSTANDNSRTVNGYFTAYVWYEFNVLIYLLSFTTNVCQVAFKHI